MRFKQTFLMILLVAALTTAFYLGRTTARPENGESGDHSEGTDHAEGSGEHGSVLRLAPDIQRKFGVQVERVENRSIQRNIETTGSVGVNQTRMAHIRVAARGRIQQVHVRLGDRVQAGQRLLAYDNAELGEAIGAYLAAGAELQKSNSETEAARQALERARSLVDLGAVARAELQRREAEHKNTLAETERRKAAAAQVEEKLHRFGLTHEDIDRLEPGGDYHREASYSVLTAPFSGVVTELETAPGESVGTEDELMTISDLAVVWVWADLYEKDIASVREGQTAEVRVAAHPDQVFTGRVTYISEVLDANTRTAKVRVETPNPGGLLKVQMFATVMIPGKETRSALMIPADALQQLDNRPVAFVRQETGSFETRELRLGHRSSTWVEVTEGLKEGDQVVTEGSFLLKSEAKKGELGHHED